MKKQRLPRQTGEVPEDGFYWVRGETDAEIEVAWLEPRLHGGSKQPWWAGPLPEPEGFVDL